MISRRFEIYWNGKWRKARYSTGKDFAYACRKHFFVPFFAVWVILGILGSDTVGDKPGLPIGTKLALLLVPLGLALVLASASLIYFRIKNERHKKW